MGRTRILNDDPWNPTPLATAFFEQIQNLWGAEKRQELEVAKHLTDLNGLKLSNSEYQEEGKNGKFENLEKMARMKLTNAWRKEL